MGERTLGRRAALGVGAGVLAAGSALGGGAWFLWDALGGHRPGATLRWSVRHDLGPAGLALAGDMVLLAGAGEAAGLDAATGSERWRRALPRDPGLAVSAAGEWLVVAQPGGGFTVAGAADGAERWRHAEAGALRQVVVDGAGVVYAVAVGDGPSAFARDAAGVRWRRPLADVPGSGPCLAAAADAVVVNAAAGGLVSLAAADGAQRWRADPPDLTPASAPFVGAGVVVALSFGAVVGLDLATGARRWRSDSHKLLRSCTGPGLDGTFAVTSRRDEEQATLTVLDARSGGVRWRADVGDGQLALAGSRVCRAAPGEVVLYDARDARTARATLPIASGTLAAAGTRLCVAAEGTLSMYEVR
jgi:outer membrane protein assembly factor BamB